MVSRVFVVVVVLYWGWGGRQSIWLLVNEKQKHIGTELELGVHFRSQCPNQTHICCVSHHKGPLRSTGNTLQPTRDIHRLTGSLRLGGTSGGLWSNLLLTAGWL